jgi:hypothetical protein
MDNKLQQELLDVIKTSKTVRDFMGDSNINIEDRKSELPFMNSVLNANKNITAAIKIYLDIEKLNG